MLTTTINLAWITGHRSRDTGSCGFVPRCLGGCPLRSCVEGMMAPLVELVLELQAGSVRLGGADAVEKSQNPHRHTPPMGHPTSYWEFPCRLSAKGTGLKTGHYIGRQECPRRSAAATFTLLPITAVCLRGARRRVQRVFRAAYADRLRPRPLYERGARRNR
jgi:hypothetical protein